MGRQYKVVAGNLLNSKEDYIVHQVNCKKVMGSGVAKAIREKHMDVYNEYVKFIEAFEEADRVPLGETLLVYVNNANYKGVINMYSQESYGYDGKQYTDYEAIERCLEGVNKLAKGESVAFPWKVGCVRGGANWEVVLNMICDKLTDVKSITFYEYQ